MRGDELLDLFEDLDEELIEEAAEATILQAPFYQKRRALLIAGVCALLALSFPMALFFSALFLEDAPVTNAGSQDFPSKNIEESEPNVNGSGDGQHSDNAYTSGENSFCPPEESVAPVDPVPSPSSSFNDPEPSDGEDVAALKLWMVSEFQLYVKENTVVAVHTMKDTQGSEILKELKAKGCVLEGMAVDEALFRLFDAMLKKGEYSQANTAYLSLQVYGDALADPQTRELFLERCAESLRKGAQSNSLNPQIIIVNETRE